MRYVYLCLGWFFVALGVVGAFLPVMPTTIFLILAAWCFARSSPELEAWLLSHPVFGTTLRNWRERGAISRRAKLLACGMILASYAFYVGYRHPSPLAATLVGLAMAAPAIYVATRPHA
jgi:uncharacterized membrane protein YbaN (DUF454 family)